VLVPPQVSYSWDWAPATPVVLSAEEKAAYREQFERKAQCVNCGGLHLRACPRVKRIVMRNKEEVSEVEFWAWGWWPTEGIIWPEDVYEGDEEENGT
jgi:hypothetical protein